jgi:isopentenyl-diphosphate delta-isomerase
VPHSTGKCLMTATEYVVLVDQQDQEIGLAEKLEAHRKNLLHRAFSVFIFRKIANQEPELLLQQRALSKYHSPGLWTNTCCSHPRNGENIIKAGERRLLEELGITAELKDVGWFHYNAYFPNGLSENEIDHVLIGYIEPNSSFKSNPEEVHATRWVTVNALQKELAMQPERFTPWLQQALLMVEAS